jgi:hypothetical protein
MYTDITQYTLRYELWSLDNSSYLENFYKEFVNDEFIRFVSLDNKTIDLADDFLICTQIAIDLSPDLIPCWLK